MTRCDRCGKRIPRPMLQPVPVTFWRPAEHGAELTATETVWLCQECLGEK